MKGAYYCTSGLKAWELRKKGSLWYVFDNEIFLEAVQVILPKKDTIQEGIVYSLK